jgi:glycosyltransferase involved in cell wall biosynthesis
MDKRLASILINNYNYGRFLRDAIDSALKQTYPHTEVIVVDDGSTDDSRKIIANYGDRIVPVLKENGGQASAFNAGFAASRGEIICFLDSDDIFLPEKVAEVMSVFERHRDIGCCFHPLRLIENDTATVLQASGEGRSHKWDLRPHIKKGKLPNELGFTAPATSGLCFRRSLLQQILPMPEASSVSISDNYVKFMSYALSRGFFLNRELALQRIHANNTYAFRDDNQQLTARIRVLTAYWMRIKLPSSARFTNKVLAAGIGGYWRTGGVQPEYKGVVKSYLSSVSVLERLEIVARALYHRLKA